MTTNETTLIKSLLEKLNEIEPDTYGEGLTLTLEYGGISTKYEFKKQDGKYVEVIVQN